MTAALASSASVPAGRDRFSFATWLFLRALALVYLVAFVSAWTQLAGLIGPNGLMPAQRFFDAIHQQYGPAAYLELPSLCWAFGGGKFLSVLCGAGVVVSLLLFAGVMPAVCLFTLWAGYLSLCCAGQIFFGYQWDALLLETTLVAIYLAPWAVLPLWRRSDPPRIARWMLWWLLFRLMFLSGLVKLTSGDLTWRNLTALTFHYETQPLPTPLAWYVHQWPAWWHKTSCVILFAIELVAPFLICAPRVWRHTAALTMAGLMVLIALTGNYTYFNFLTIALCLLCLDDAWWSRALRRALEPAREAVRAVPAGPLGAFAMLVLAITTLMTLATATRSVTLFRAAVAVEHVVGPFRSFNTYGLFAMMTNPRPELVIEGSDDGHTWVPYELPDKPGALTRRPTWVAPFQPRLDWQLWFAALEQPEQNQWVLGLCEALLKGNPDVLALFAKNPFPDHPPHTVRVVRYEYHFTDAETRRRTGEWWRRTPVDFYVQPAALPSTPAAP